MSSLLASAFGAKVVGSTLIGNPALLLSRGNSGISGLELAAACVFKNLAATVAGDLISIWIVALHSIILFLS